MRDCCDMPADDGALADRRYRRVLWTVLGLNAAMFLVEVVGGWIAGSVSLQADALDFLGDAANYGISLLVLGMALAWRATAGLLKGCSMGLFGLWVLAHTAYQALYGGVPGAALMGGVGTLALLVNVACAVLLFAFRHGDSNMRSVWLCSRNDVLGNLAVLLAASGVFATRAAWPDLAVGALISVLALTSAVRVVVQALGEFQVARVGERAAAD